MTRKILLGGERFIMNNIQKILENQRNYFNTGATRDLEFRIEKLSILKKSIKKNEKQILEALWVDLHKSELDRKSVV